MKAISFASLLALGIAGSACSQTVDAEDATPAPEAEAANTDTGGSFNLGVPGDVGDASAANSDGFNLALPSAEPTSTDGFNLGTDVSTSNGLSDLPEIAADLTEAPSDSVIEAPVTDNADEEPVIRLD